MISLYQLPLIENTLNKYGFTNNINDKLSFSKDAQEIVESEKIKLASSLNSNTGKSGLIKKVSSTTVDTKSSNVGNNVNNSSENTVSLSQNSVSKTVNKCSEKCTILMIGDSVMGDIYLAVNKKIRVSHPDWKVVDGHKVSSGLSNSTYYDWPKVAKDLVDANKPDYVFVLFGTNDAQNIVKEGKVLVFGKDTWIDEYSNRVEHINHILDDSKSYWKWIELPVVKLHKFNDKLEVIRTISDKVNKDNLIATESLFGKRDLSEPFNIKIRAKDGIHLNIKGSDELADEIVNSINN